MNLMLQLNGRCDIRDALQYLAYFFFSSRRRHTRCGRDWSSDVCSSDLSSSSWARADWRKRRRGSRGTACAGTNASTSWTRLSRNSHERRRAMNARIESEPGPVKNRTTVERKSHREVVVTRTINGRARIVFEAFTKAELLKRWWVPKSLGMTLLSCEVDARVGG